MIRMHATDLTKELRMIWEQIEGKWLNVQDTDATTSNRARLGGAAFTAKRMAFVATLQKHCGLPRYDAEQQISAWIAVLS